MLTKASLEKALPNLLRPLVRLCLRYAVKVGEMESILKILFVEEAQMMLLKDQEQQSVSKVSIMTGIQRPAVAEILKKKTLPDSMPKTNLMMKVIGAWQTKPSFTTSTGKPRVLQCEGKQSEFAKLVASVSQALNPYTVLFELERAKLVEKSPRGLKLLSHSFIAHHDVNQTLEFLSSDVTDLTSAVEENVNAIATPRNHHLTTEFDSIPESKIEEIKLKLLEEGEKLHARIRALLSSYDTDIKNTKSPQAASRTRVAFCSFAHCEKIESKRNIQ